MFSVKNNTLYFTRGDKVSLNLSIEGYVFQPDDKIAFRIYDKNRLNLKFLSEVVTTVEESAAVVKITLPPEATRIGKITNKPVEYWYEIELNDEQTIIGYDDNGPKTVIIYPEGETNGDE